MKKGDTMKWFLMMCLWLSVLASNGNNIQVTNVVLTGQNKINGTTQVQFNLSWENSWRTSTAPNNWDAAWVFVKYRIAGSTDEWKHADLNENGHLIPSGSSIEVGMLDPNSPFNSSTNPGIGAFVYRSTNGTGTFSLSNVQLQWNYAADGINSASGVEVRVFAIEMVYVSPGAFYVGDGDNNLLKGQLHDASSSTTPFFINSESAITLGGTASGNLSRYIDPNYDSGDDFDDGTTQNLPADYPKGFNDFYCMKYEITQQQWLDFFNSLNTTQKNTRDITGGQGKSSDGVKFRNSLSWTSGDANLSGNTNASVACNYLSWMDLAAYLDWSGLRPMTDLEFEKVCRGPVSPVYQEYAWGSANLNRPTVLSNDGTSNEGISSGYSTIAGNVNINNPNAVAPFDGPYRVGIFAGHPTNDGRQPSGAGYYGAMELSGNVWERVVSLTNGRSYSGLHGNGVLNVNGNANTAAWPGINGGEVTDAKGAGFRGGSWRYSDFEGHISSRSLSNTEDIARNNDAGGRGVRSRPSKVTDIDNNTYPIITIGTQTWMAENLRTNKYSDGSSIPLVTAANSWSVGTTPKMCWYNNDQATYMANKYGALYNWYAVNPTTNGNKNVCPTGWHVPADGEWTTLTDYLGGLSVAGGKMKSIQYWTSPNTGATNESGFSGVSGGYRYNDGTFSNVGDDGYWWSSTQNSTTNAWFLYLGYFNGDVYRDATNKVRGFSVRCIKD